MNLIFFCQSTDTSDPIIADTKDRILAFTSLDEIERVLLFTTRSSQYLFEDKIKHVNLDVPKKGRFFALLKFYLEIIHFMNGKPTLFYCYMTPTIAILVWPFRLFKNFKIAIWFAHSQFRSLVKFNLKYVANLWFAPNAAHAKLNYSNLRIVGQAVDLEFFSPLNESNYQNKKYDLITAGRLTPVKKFENIIQAVAMLRDNHNTKCKLAICGDAYSEYDLNYKNELINLIKKNNLEDQIELLGSLSKNDLRNHLRISKFFIFPQVGGISKAVVEAISCGLPVIICDSAKDFWGEEFDTVFVTGPKPETLGKKILEFHQWDYSYYQIISKKCRDLAVNNGGQKQLFAKIFIEVKLLLD